MPLPKPSKNEEKSKFISRCISFAVRDGMEQERAIAACHTQWRNKMKSKGDSLMFEYFVPIESSAEIDGDFTINGIAINETTTSNGHKFIGEELDKAAHTLIGVPLLKDHDNSVDSIVGRVNQAHWDESLRNISFTAVVKDSKVKQLIKDNLLNSVSVGAHVDPKDIEEIDGEIIPHNIQFKELSVVAVPADGGATFSVAFNNAYKSHSTNVGETIERRDNMTEEEMETEETETKEEETEKSKEETEVSDEEKKIDEKIAKLRIIAKKKQLALMEADADEESREETKEEPKEEPKKEEAEEEEESEEEEEESEEVEEKGDYKFNQGHNFIGIERKSYVYN